MQRNLRRYVFLHEYELGWADKVHAIHPLPSRSQSEAMWTRYLRSYQPPCDRWDNERLRLTAASITTVIKRRGPDADSVVPVAEDPGTTATPVV